MKRMLLIIGCSVLLTSCSEKNNIDNIVSEKWEKCDNHVDCVVEFATSMQFQWDTMYFAKSIFKMQVIDQIHSV